MTPYSTLCDDFYVNISLNTQMELPANRETVLHFFELIQRRFPSMRSFYCREHGGYVLEEDKEKEGFRWCSIEPRRVLSGQVKPESIEGALDQHRMVLELAPFELSVTPLDCEALDLLFGFDFTCRGNHNELVLEALGAIPAFERLVHLPGTRTVNYEPSVVIALDPECRLHCRVAIETRTSPYQIRTEDYAEDLISVYVTARHSGSLPPGHSFPEVLDQLERVCHDVLENCVVDQVLRPLARTIASK